MDSPISGVVNDSAVVNIVLPTGLEDGSVVVTTYNWQDYLLVLQEAEGHQEAAPLAI